MAGLPTGGVGFGAGKPSSGKPPGGAGGGKPPKPPAPKPPKATGGSKPPSNPNAPRGHWVPMGDKWQLIHATGPGQWAPGGVAGAPAPARPHGPTPLPNNPMSPLTQNQVKRTATSTITAGYNPAFTDLNQQGTTAQNLYSKQSSDAKYFSDWLAQKGQEMTGAVGGVNQQLANLVQGINAQTAQQQAAIPNMAAQTAAQTGQGNAPNNVYTQMIPQVLAGQGLRAQGQEAGATERAMLGPVDVAQQAGVNQARVQALRGQQSDTLNKTMNSIANERTKLLQSRTGDIAKEIARLQGVELQKRQYLMSQSALEKQMGLKAQAQYATNLLNAGKLQVAQQTANTGAKNAATNAGRVAEIARHNSAVEQITSAHYANAAQQGQALAAEKARHDRATEGIGAENAATRAASAGVTGGHLPKGVKPLGTASANALARRVNNLMYELNSVKRKYYSTGPNVQMGNTNSYHDIASGRVYSSAYGGDKALLNAAYNLWTGHGLSKGDIAALQQKGLKNPTAYF
jgi:hypothetical protein